MENLEELCGEDQLFFDFSVQLDVIKPNESLLELTSDKKMMPALRRE